MPALGDTIAALSTPPGRGGLGVIRISGPDALTISRKFLQLRPVLEPRCAYLGRMCDAGGELVDEAVVTWYQAPKSYTGQDVVELSCHGSPVILAHALERAVAAGARLAEPGEFTLRAFLHGRMDLPQAEAVRDLIDSTTLYQAKVAASQQQGALSNRLVPVKQKLIDLVALMEAGIDFADDDVSVAPAEEIEFRIKTVLDEVRKLEQSFQWGKLVRDGFTLAIAGPPNAGKSSLFNALLGRERAIVTPIPGTTRDTVSETVAIHGIPVRLVDTAGIRETQDSIEMLGIERSYEAAADADVTLVVIDASLLSHAPAPWQQRLGATGAQLRIANKCDLEQARIPEGYIAVSAKTGQGISDLREAVLHLLSPNGIGTEAGFVTSLRQRDLFSEAAQMLEKGLNAVHSGIPHEMILLDLYGALSPLDKVSGATTADDILGNIFSKFCIGK